MLRHATKKLLEEKNYEIFESTGCFDIAAKKKRFFLLKILKNIDALLFHHAHSLKALALSLNAFPFVIGERTNRERLEKNIVYERFGIPAVNLDTFELVLSGETSCVFRDRGGTYAEIHPEKLRNARKELGLTQRKLAQLAGVSPKTIYIHEKCFRRSPISLIEKLEKILKRDIRNKSIARREFEISSFPLEEFEKYVMEKFISLGFEALPVKKSPADIVARESEIILSEVETNVKRLKYRIERFEKFLEFTRCAGAVITEEIKKEFSIPVINRRELENVTTKHELLKLIKNY